jgi:DNA-binding response OmpR family regulator
MFMLTEISSRKRVAAGAGRIALVVEDDPRLQGAMTKALARMDLHVLSASHYDAAVGHLWANEPQIVCIDVGLPSKSGYELCEYIRGLRAYRMVPILVTSEHGHPEDMAHAEEAGGNAFLRKPFSMGQLTACVESLIDQSAFGALPSHLLQMQGPNPASARHIVKIATIPNRHGGPEHRSAA